MLKCGHAGDKRGRESVSGRWIFNIKRIYAKEVMRMKWLSLCLIVFSLLSFGIVGLSSAQDWDKGENRIPNSDFEMDPNGAEPTGWTLEDGT
jgi:hypothetical protein